MFWFQDILNILLYKYIVHERNTMGLLHYYTISFIYHPSLLHLGWGVFLHSLFFQLNPNLFQKKIRKIEI